MSKHPSCSSCARLGGCQSPYSCQVPEQETTAAVPWQVVAWIFVAAMAVAAAVVPFF